MAEFDLDTLEPGVDIDAIDTAGQDRGDTLDALEEALRDEPEQEEVEAKEVEAKEPETEEEPEPEVDAEDTKEAEEEPARDEKGKFAAKEAKIPKGRFDEAVGKERDAREAAERRADALEKQIRESQAAQKQNADTEAMEAKVAELEKQYGALLLDGEGDKAAEVMREIRMAERNIAKIESAALAAQQTTNALEADRMDAAIARLEADHPILNPDSDQFDESLVGFVLSEQSRLIKIEGLTPSRALSRAATVILGKYGPKADPAPDEKKGLAKVAEDRKAVQVAKNLAASKAQPAPMRDAGLDSDKAGATAGIPDIRGMSQEDFNALPEKTRARMRGDIL